MKARVILLIAVLFWSAACTKRENKSGEPEIQMSELEMPAITTAQQNIEEVCYMCHHPTAGPEDRIAPPLEIAKRNYLANTSTREEFVEKMVQFILYPTAEQSVMHSDVEQYGLMDPLGFSKDEVKAMAEFIYDNELPKPDWLMEN